MTTASKKITLKDGSIIEGPRRFKVDSSWGPLVLEITNRVLTLRPKGCKRGGPAEHSTSFGKIFQRIVADDLAAKQKTKKMKRQRRI